jgi:hypothetical protein
VLKAAGHTPTSIPSSLRRGARRAGWCIVSCGLIIEADRLPILRNVGRFSCRELQPTSISSLDKESLSRRRLPAPPEAGGSTRRGACPARAGRWFDTQASRHHLLPTGTSANHHQHISISADRFILPSSPRRTSAVQAPYKRRTSLIPNWYPNPIILSPVLQSQIKKTRSSTIAGCLINSNICGVILSVHLNHSLLCVSFLPFHCCLQQ